MDLTQLRYFLRVAQLGSFTKAAAALHIAQPAITRQVRLLEEELGVVLLLRHSRGAEATEAGRKLAAGAESIFRNVAQLRAEVIASSHSVSGNLRVGFPPSVGDLLVSNVVTVYRQRYPDVVLSLREGYSEALRDDLLGDRLDLAVITGGETNPLLTATPLYEEQLWVLEANGRSALSSVGRSYSLADVAKRPLIQPSRTNTLRLLLESKAADEGLELNVVVEAEALHLIKELVRKGVGCHVSPYSAVSGEIGHGDFAGGPLKGLVVSRHLVRRIDRPVGAALLSFMKTFDAEVARAERAACGAIRRPAPQAREPARRAARSR
jgi:LysR family nitrogen assimilation transcriptional regulator